jgi:transposase-like protein
MKLTKRSFNREFKISVCEEIEHGLKTQAQISREHMIGSALISQWLGQYRKDPLGCFKGRGFHRATINSDEARVKELEAALGRATLENKILRDANLLLKKMQLEQRKFTK